MTAETRGRDASLEADVRLAQTVAHITTATKGVSALSPGRHAEAATYAPGQVVRGVVVGPDGIRVHIVAAYPAGFPIPRLADRLRARISEHVRDTPISIVVDDMEEET